MQKKNNNQKGKRNNKNHGIDVKTEAFSLISPILPKFEIQDVLQVIIGASILAIPVGFTEETWKLGEMLPLANIIGLITATLLFLTAFSYYHYHHRYKETIKQHWKELFKRVFATYIFSFIVVGMLMTLIQRAPWMTDLLLAFKRVAIITFPSSMSAAIADILK